MFRILVMDINRKIVGNHLNINDLNEFFKNIEFEELQENYYVVEKMVE